MKLRQGFVSNSSSCSFYITNKTEEILSLADFVIENPQLMQEFLDQYDWHKDDEGFTQEHLIDSAYANNEIFEPHDHKMCVFGDEDGTLIGQVFDYILREGGESKSFRWEFDAYRR